MARQSTTPVQFNRSVRKDRVVMMSSARAGLVVPVAYIPLLPGDSASGRVGIDIQLKEMPKPLLNGVTANFQAWFVPKSAHPQFAGRDELRHAMTGEAIKSLGFADRSPPTFFTAVSGGNKTALESSTFFKTLGIHLPSGSKLQSDLVDAFSLIYNFRLAAHSSALTRKKYVAEDAAAAVALPPAFWPSSRLSRVVPDYERALVVGALDLDVVAGRLPVEGLFVDTPSGGSALGAGWVDVKGRNQLPGGGAEGIARKADKVGIAGRQDNGVWIADVFADMVGQSIGVTLADIDKARTTQAFAKLRTSYAGNDATGFDNDDSIVALLMQGISVPPDEFKRPWLLDSKRVPVGFSERFASDGASLDQSVTLGRASAVLSLNVPVQDVSGLIIVTVEVLPERIDERMSDEWLSAEDFDSLPNALRDVQRVEPVDLVPNRRVDAKHTSPGNLYGYEPMNDVWNREFTRLGGDFYQATPGSGFTENRSNIWQTEIVDPTFSSTHYLAPQPFPHSPFSDTTADAFEIVCRHDVSIMGLTQIGDVLVENNDDYDAVEGAGLPPSP